VPSGIYFGWAGIQLPPSLLLHPSVSPDALLTASTPTAATATAADPPLSRPVPEGVPPEPKQREGWRLFPMVMSIGYNPFYKNSVRSAEVHVLHQFPEDFYGAEMAVSILGYIRPEYDYVSVEGLIKDISEDIEVTKRSLDREVWKGRLRDPYLWGEREDKA
jgi:riboflavin kinase